MIQTNKITAFLLSLIFCCSPDRKEPIVFKSTNIRKWQDNELALLDIINEYRYNNNKSILVQDDAHYDIALGRTLSNIEKGKISHEWFYTEVQDKLKEMGVPRSAENLGFRFITVKGMFDAWVRSKEHKSAMLGDWNYTGICIIKHMGSEYYCQIFGK